MCDKSRFKAWLVNDENDDLRERERERGGDKIENGQRKREMKEKEKESEGRKREMFKNKFKIIIQQTIKEKKISDFLIPCFCCPHDFSVGIFFSLLQG